jgi:2-(1,2-epoxy-1,2-dihydrophenyl)acetyl-CoA isomerase
LVTTRQLLRDGTGVDLNTQLDAERDAQSRMGKTNDHYEGVVAFLQKRPAVFKGH